MSQTERLIYGDHPSQHIEVWRPDGPVHALVFMIHGGFWREVFGADLTAPITENLSSEGYLVANIEYRRVGGGGGWPATFHDVQAAIGSVRQRFPEPVTSFVVGHSVGGQLALLALASGLADFGVALAPLSDIARALSEGTGDDAAADFLGDAQHAPDEVAAASPITKLGHQRSHLVVHGARDVDVPVEHSRHYVAQARSLRAPVDYFEFASLDHLDLIDPGSVGWHTAKQWITSQQ